MFENDGEAELALAMNGKPTDAFVTVTAEMFYLTKKSSSLTLPEFGGKNKLCGLLTVIVTKAFDIPLPKEGETIAGLHQVSTMILNFPSHAPLYFGIFNFQIVQLW